MHQARNRATVQRVLALRASHDTVSAQDRNCRRYIYMFPGGFILRSVFCYRRTVFDR